MQVYCSHEYLLRRTPSSTSQAQISYLETVVVPSVEDALYVAAEGERAAYLDPTTLKARLKKIFVQRASGKSAAAAAEGTSTSSSDTNASDGTSGSGAGATSPASGVPASKLTRRHPSKLHTPSGKAVDSIAEVENEDEEPDSEPATDASGIAQANSSHHSSVRGTGSPSDTNTVSASVRDSTSRSSSYVLAPRWGNASHPWADAAGKSPLIGHVIRHYPCQVRVWRDVFVCLTCNTV